MKRIKMSIRKRLKSLLQTFIYLGLVNLLAGCSAFAGSGPVHIAVQWTTGSEINTAGFNLYRSESAAGPFNRINAQLIPAANDPIAGGKYHYEDDDVKPGQTYYYELEDVELGGASTRHGPIVIVAPSAEGIEGMAPVLLLLGLVLLALIVLGSVWRARRPQTNKVVIPPKASK
jgi:hypothetical protein